MNPLTKKQIKAERKAEARQRAAKFNRVIVHVISPVFLVASLYIWVLFSTGLYSSLLATYTWHPATATVLSFDTIRSEGLNSSMRAGGIKLQRLVATYEYEVSGQKYQGTRVRIFENAANFDQAYTDELRNQLATGQVSVLYDPTAPQHAIIDARFTPGHAGFYSLFMVLFGVLGMGYVSAVAGAAGILAFRLYMAAAPLLLAAGLAQTLTLGPSLGAAMLGLFTAAQFWLSFVTITQKPTPPAA